MTDAPAFDPNKPFEVAGADATDAPAFDPSQPFEAEQAQAAPSTDYAAQIAKVQAQNIPDFSKRGIIADLQERQQSEENPLPLGDFFGDTGRAAASARDMLVSSAASASPSLVERDQQRRERVAKYGPVAGTLADMGADLGRFGDAVKVPLAAMGIIASPIAGLIHSTAGSILSYIPGMDKNRANELTDLLSMGIAPATMEKGFGAMGRGAQEIGAAPQAAAADVNAANDAARAANPALAQARDAGYVVHPAESGASSTVGNVASQFGGKIKTQQAASVKNQEVTNGIAARELGLPADATLDETTFNSVRGRSANAYKVIQNSAASLPTGRIIADQDFLTQVADLGSSSAEYAADFPEAAADRSASIERLQKQVLKQDFSPKAGVEMIRNLRDDARINLKNWGDADKTRLGLAQREAADAIESLIERRLTDAGNPNAVANYQAARQTIAKSHDIEAATNAAGDVDARKLAALGQKRPLSGGLKLIAETASAFPKSMQVPAKFGGLEKRSILDTLWSLGTGATGVATGHPLTGLAVAGAPLVRPLARDLALSKGVQNSLLGLRQQPGNLGPIFKAGALPTAVGVNDLGLLQREIARLFAPSTQPPPQQ